MTQPAVPSPRQTRRSAEETELDAAVTERLVGLAMRLWLEDETAISELARFADVQRTGHSYTLRGPSGITVGVVLGADPVTQAVGLGFLLVGQLWPRFLPNLLPAVNKAWRKHLEEEKKRKRKTDATERDD